MPSLLLWLSFGITCPFSPQPVHRAPIMLSFRTVLKTWLFLQHWAGMICELKGYYVFVSLSSVKWGDSIIVVVDVLLKGLKDQVGDISSWRKSIYVVSKS